MDVTIVSSAPATSPAAVDADDHPGRWLGGAIGALASILSAFVATLLGWSLTTFDGAYLLGIGLLGMPVGFVLGRAALPSVRAGGWPEAIGIGLLIGLAAAPLGAIELVLAAGTLGDISGVGTCGEPGLVGALVLLIFAIPFSLVAIIVTIPAGIAWSLATRAVPVTWLARARMPRPIAALGVRHAVWLAGAILAVVTMAQIVATTQCAASLTVGVAA